MTEQVANVTEVLQPLVVTAALTPLRIAAIRLSASPVPQQGVGLVDKVFNQGAENTLLAYKHLISVSPLKVTLVAPLLGFCGNDFAHLLVDALWWRLVPWGGNLFPSLFAKDLLSTAVWYIPNHMWDVWTAGRLSTSFSRTNVEQEGGPISVGDIFGWHRGMTSGLLLAVAISSLNTALNLLLPPYYGEHEEEDDDPAVRHTGWARNVGRWIVGSVAESALLTVLLRVTLHPNLYRGGIIATTRQIYTEEGLPGFFKGFIANALYSVLFEVSAYI